MMTAAEIGVMHVKDRGRGHKPRNTGGHERLKKSRKQILSWKSPALLTF